MDLGNGSAALVTGAGSGIGRAVSLDLAKRGVNVTVLDFSKSDGEETVRLIKTERANIRPAPLAPAAVFVQCDVADPEQLAEAFQVHEHTYGRLDVLLNNAGIGDDVKFWDDISTDASGRWRKVLNVNFSAVIDGTRLAIQLMRRTSRPGVIVNMASAVGLYPSFHAPIYSSTKGGVVMLTRSLASLKPEGIRVNALCPEHVQTNLTKDLPSNVTRNGFIPMETIVKGIFQLIQDEDKAGACLLVTNKGGAEYWPATVTLPDPGIKSIEVPASKPKGVLRSGLEALAQMEGLLQSLLTFGRKESLLWSLSLAKRAYYSLLLATGSESGQFGLVSRSPKITLKRENSLTSTVVPIV